MYFDWISMIRELGPLVSAILFFIWRDWKREQRLSKRIEKLDDYHKETLVHLVEKGTTILVQNSEIMKWVGRVIEHLCNRYPYIDFPNKPESRE
jgi:hypothetical protein